MIPLAMHRRTRQHKCERRNLYPMTRAYYSNVEKAGLDQGSEHCEDLLRRPATFSRDQQSTDITRSAEQR